MIAVAPVVGQHRDVAVQLAVELHALHDLRAVGLEPAVHVVEAHARDRARDRVEDLRRDAARQRVAALRLPAGDEVEALVELRQQARDLGRVVLQVAVDRDDDRRPPPRAKPASSAAALPKLRRRRTTRTLSCASWRRVSAPKVPSVEPSSTKIASQVRPRSGASAAASSS